MPAARLIEFRRDRVVRVGDDAPGFGGGEAEREARLQVGLVEAGEGRARVRGDEERVDVLGVVLAVEVARDGATRSADGRVEVQLDGVRARGQVRARDDE